MMEWTMTFCGFVLVLSIMAGLIRMVVGPTILDRILSFDMLSVCGVAFMAILTLRWHTTLFLELILIFTLLGFFSTVALVVYLDRAHPKFSDDDDGRPEGQHSEQGGGSGRGA